ncbi:MAG: serine/threonine-protein phosphatase [Proteobacteria bacterium]|nr:serine/threonine-protein phosphatase [Pseudomonadota bacterium]
MPPNPPARRTAGERAAKPVVSYNFLKRSLRIPGLAGVRLRAGSFGPHNHSGLGDCVLIDLGKNFFAVSDSSDRDSTTSRKLLSEFATMLAGFSGFGPRRTYSSEALERLKRRFVRAGEKALETIPYFESCTLTAVLITRTHDGLRALLLHSGDSFLLMCGPDGRARQLTQNNFWMIGRAKQFYQIDLLELPAGASLLLATDGFSDLVFPEGRDRRAAAADLVGRLAPEQAADALVDRFDRKGERVDDLGLCVIRPEALKAGRARILIGGTTRAEEKTFEEKSLKGYYRDEYTVLEDGAGFMTIP